VVNATWHAATRIKAGVGDVVWRIMDDQAQVEYSVAGQSGGRVMPCAICIIHVEGMRSVGFLVAMVCQWFGLKTGGDDLLVVCPQNYYDDFLVWTSKPSSMVWWFGLKTTATVW
jgi:hypothetical protein